MSDDFNHWPHSRRSFLGQLAVGATAAGLLPSVEASRQSKPAVDAGKIKICIFSKHLQWLPYEGMAETAAELGFEGVDLTVRSNGHVLPERVETDLPKAAEAARKAGIEISMITTAVNDPEDPRTSAILETAAASSIGYYRLGYFKYQPGTDIPAQLARIRPRVVGLAEVNRRYRIYGGYQNHAGRDYVGAPLWDWWELIKDLDPEWIGCQFDIRHATVESANAWPINFRLLAPYTRILAIKDFKWEKEGGTWKVTNCPLGEGQVDFKSFFRLLKDSGFSGPISVHYEYSLGGAEHGARSLDLPRTEVLAAFKRDLDVLKGWVEVDH
ncbi:MAG: sugar phosphate isomerase/epimerase family protein [Acidobacteriota bacterium]